MRHWLLGGLAALAVAGASPAAARSWVVQDQPYVALIADLPDNSGFEGYHEDRGMVPLDLGWSYREISGLWMPFWAYRDQGLVLFSKAPDGSYMLAPVSDAELAKIKDVTGRDVASEYSFPLANHLWGWLPMVALLGFIFWLRRRETRRREALGVI